ncbi:MAG: hypothetical protein J0L97_07850 [Alphaproteobacteria bacterium]|nr:hypothetical protein [Alphaproteobacteria bacterium]
MSLQEVQRAILLSLTDLLEIVDAFQGGHSQRHNTLRIDDTDLRLARETAISHDDDPLILQVKTALNNYTDEQGTQGKQIAFSFNILTLGTPMALAYGPTNAITGIRDQIEASLHRLLDEAGLIQGGKSQHWDDQLPGTGWVRHPLNPGIVFKDTFSLTQKGDPCYTRDGTPARISAYNQHIALFVHEDDMEKFPSSLRTQIQPLQETLAEPATWTSRWEQQQPLGRFLG